MPPFVRTAAAFLFAASAIADDGTRLEWKLNAGDVFEVTLKTTEHTGRSVRMRDAVEKDLVIEPEKYATTIARMRLTVRGAHSDASGDVNADIHLLHFEIRPPAGSADKPIVYEEAEMKDLDDTAVFIKGGPILFGYGGYKKGPNEVWAWASRLPVELVPALPEGPVKEGSSWVASARTEMVYGKERFVLAKHGATGQTSASAITGAKPSPYDAGAVGPGREFLNRFEYRRTAEFDPAAGHLRFCEVEERRVARVEKSDLGTFVHAYYFKSRLEVSRAGK
ncbi:MAG: hypothetical protein HYY18_00620 [Planctomycetes bacterium]|nr:hypothetical protein [Planctomycetota bacterium]